MDTESKIKFVVVGAGHIGKRHAEIICSNAEAELVAIVDVKNKEDLKIENLKVPFFKSLDLFLESEIKADVVTIATPNYLHAEQAIKCIENGLHAVIEKPMALRKDEAQKIISQAEKFGKHIFPVMQNRYSPPAVWIRNIADRKVLGQIFMVQLSCYWNRDERYYKNDSWHGKREMDGGTLFTQFSHFIDIIFWLFGDIQNVKSIFKNFNHALLTEFEDSGIITFELENGAAGSLNFSTSVWDKNMESSITVIAENGSVKIGGQYMDKVEYCHIKNYEMPELKATNAGNNYEGGYQGSAANHHYVFENVIDVLKGRADITTKPEEGMKVVEIIEKIYASKEAV